MRALAAAAAIIAVMTAAIVMPTAGAAPNPSSYRWTEAYLPGPAGTKLHADVLRPAGIPDDQRTPVIMTVSPYRSHTAYLSMPLLNRAPSTQNLPVEWALAAGYTYVIADLPGYGGSSGCPDWGGPTEQEGVEAAVEWAAAQPWSTGKVGLYGVSYEAWTGLMALAERPKGLAAVGAFEPVPDPYAYLYTQGIPRRFSLNPISYYGIKPSDPQIAVEHAAIASTPGRPDDTPEYQAAAVNTPQSCLPDYVRAMSNRDPNTPFWQSRNLIEQVRGTTTPTFIGQGFVDVNTMPEKTFDFWNALGQGEHKAWFGQWGHRDCFTDCRPTYAAEIYAFFDKHVAGKPVDVPGPRVTVGQFYGAWRSESAWPPADMRMVPVPLRTGRYLDRGLGVPGPDREIWSVSAPLAAEQHLSGLATVEATAIGPAGASLAAEIYDIAPDGRATVVTRGIAPLGPDGAPRIRMFAQDWPFPAGHRVGIKLTDTVDDVWANWPTFAWITLTRATIELPLLTRSRVPDLDGGPTDGVGRRLRDKTITLDGALINGSVVPIDFPTRS